MLDLLFLRDHISNTYMLSNNHHDTQYYFHVKCEHYYID